MPCRQAVVAAGEVAPLEGDEIEHLAEGDRAHGEIDAAQARDQRADYRGGHCADQNAEQRSPAACSSTRYFIIMAVP